MKGLFTMVIIILSLPTSIMAQEAPTAEEISNKICVMDYKIMWLNRGCKPKIGYACCGW